MVQLAENEFSGFKWATALRIKKIYKKKVDYDTCVHDAAGACKCKLLVILRKRN